MDRILIVNIIEAVKNAFLILILIQITLKYVLEPFHPLRRAIDGVIEPLLAPIRRIVPPMGRFDFSALILMVIVEIIATILRNVLL